MTNSAGIVLNYSTRRFLKGFKIELRRHVERHLVSIMEENGNDNVDVNDVQTAISRAYKDYQENASREIDSEVAESALKAYQEGNSKSPKEWINELQCAGA